MTAPLFTCAPNDCYGHLTFSGAKRCAGGDSGQVGYVMWLGMWFAEGKR